MKKIIACLLLVVAIVFSSVTVPANAAVKQKSGWEFSMGKFIPLWLVKSDQQSRVTTFYPWRYDNNTYAYPTWDEYGIPGTPCTASTWWVNRQSNIQWSGTVSGVAVYYIVADGCGTNWPQGAGIAY